MKPIIHWMLAIGMVAHIAATHGEVVSLEQAPTLPLALEDDFRFGKVKLFLNDTGTRETNPMVDRMIRFEQRFRDHGAVTNHERAERRGHYFTIWWDARREADLTIRLEYRQANLGPYVLAKEVSHQGVKGRQRTDFEVIGDEYLIDGKITSWRAILIENGRIVAMHPSFMWN